jgi:uncharacterized membrane protein YhhN
MGRVMPNGFLPLTVAALLAGGVHLGAYYRAHARLAGIAKALPIVLLLGWVVLHAQVVGETYRWLVAAGLLFSVAGDLLLLSRARFRAGLAAFFVGHVCYTLAFSMTSACEPRLGVLLVLLLVGGGILRVLWPHVARERIPVASYIVMISIMAWTAVGRSVCPATPEPSGVLAAAGAAVFMTSDATLALDRFVRRWHGAHAAVMVTYYAAQILIAASVDGPPITNALA